MTDLSVLTDGSAQACGGDCAMFKGVAARSLRVYAQLAEPKFKTKVGLRGSAIHQRLCYYVPFGSF